MDGEYFYDEFQYYLGKNRIRVEPTISYTHQQNGVANLMNRTLMYLVRAIKIHRGVDYRIWAEVLFTAVYVRNRDTSRSLPENLTPHHFWNGNAPDISHLRVFGSKCLYDIPRTKIKKLDSCTAEAMMAGYSSQKKGYT